jgi:heme-degrading monooxygenase HmoA
MTNTIALIRHRVNDFETWKKVYDGFAPTQTEHGVHAHQVLRSIENPNDVIVTHTFESSEAARAFFDMPELKEAMSGGASIPTPSTSPISTRSKPACWSARSQMGGRAAVAPQAPSGYGLGGCASLD